MSALIKAVRRLEYANFLIRKKATGNLETFARKMNLSKSSVKNLLQQMKELGADIKFDRTRNTYYYTENGEFCIPKFMFYGETLTRAEISKIGRVENLCFSEKAVFVPCEDL